MSSVNKAKILIQIDPDNHASTFDSVVAIDAGVDHLLVHDGVNSEDIQGLVHGAIFTRGPEDLKSTALFFGGSNVAKTQQLVQQAKASFFGPLQVSLMSDPNGANTTAAAAVLAVQKHHAFENKIITILAGTGPVGMRIAQLIAGPASTDDSVTLRICSRQLEKAQSVCDEIRISVPNANLVPFETATPEQALASVGQADVVFAAGAAGVELLPAGWQESNSLKVAVDLNGVPPAGIAGISALDKAKKHGSMICYGAIGIGGLKMKIHKRCLQMLFESNCHTLEVAEIFAIGQEI